MEILIGKRVSQLLAALVLIGLGTPTSQAQQFNITWYRIANGGGYATAGNFDLDASIGQHGVGQPMTGGPYMVSSGFWAGGSDSGGPSTVCAGDGSLVEGFGQVGDFNATCGSDDDYWAAHGASLFFQVADPVVQFELTATAPAGFSGNTISVDIEASKANNSATLFLRAQLYNFDTASYVALPGILSPTTSDQTQNFLLPGGADPADFIEPGSNDVRLLVQTIQTSGLPNVRTQLDEVLFNFE